MDLDYDAISQAVTVTGTWPVAYRNGTDGPKRTDDDRVEIGILNREKSTEEESVSLGGFLTVLGEDEEPSQSHISA